MWYTRYIDFFFFFSCAQGNINILEPWTGVPCDSLQRVLSDCVHDRVDDIIKYSHFLLELEWKYELMSGLARALLRSALAKDNDSAPITKPSQNTNTASE